MGKNTLTREIRNEKWFTDHWRPAMAWLYMAICGFDFLVAPIACMLLPNFLPGMDHMVWDPITLKGGGLIHMSFGAIVGVTAWGRSKEKVAEWNSPATPDSSDDSQKTQPGD